MINDYVLKRFLMLRGVYIEKKWGEKIRRLVLGNYNWSFNVDCISGIKGKNYYKYIFKREIWSSLDVD